jgi:hypothetical protein
VALNSGGKLIGGVILFMRRPFIESAVPAGLAFEVADLILLQSWAAFHELRMVIELDHCGADGQYEEMIAIYARGKHLLRWLLWRAGEIVVQPLIGRRIHCPSVAEAIETLSPQL